MSHFDDALLPEGWTAQEFKLDPRQNTIRTGEGKFVAFCQVDSTIPLTAHLRYLWNRHLDSLPLEQQPDQEPPEAAQVPHPNVIIER